MLIGMTIPLTGTQYEIEAGEYRATVTELGAGLRQLEHSGTPLVTTFDADQLPPHSAGELLSPWPNRVDAGRYSFDGARYQLALSEPALGNAIHGLTRWVPWTRTAHDRSEVTLTSVPHGSQGYPFAVQVDVTYRVDAESGLHVTVPVGAGPPGVLSVTVKGTVTGPAVTVFRVGERASVSMVIAVVVECTTGTAVTVTLVVPLERTCVALPP